MNNYAFGGRYGRDFNQRTANSQHRVQVPSYQDVWNHFSSFYREVFGIKQNFHLEGLSSETKKDSEAFIRKSRMVMMYSLFDLFMHEMLYLSYSKMRNSPQVRTAGFSGFSSNVNLDEIERMSDRKFYEMLEGTFGEKSLTSNRMWASAVSDMGVSPKAIAIDLWKKRNIACIDDNANTMLEKRMREMTKRRNLLVHSYNTQVLSREPETLTDADVEDFISFARDLIDVVFRKVSALYN